MIALQHVARTCEACPAQLEGVTMDGQSFYARYRSGRLRWGLGATSRDAVAAAMESDGTVLGHRNDGWMSTHLMLLHARARVIA